MSNPTRAPETSKQPKEPASTAAGPTAKPEKPQQRETAEEVLRDQTKTETEQRPYLDTEGGE